MLKLVQVFATGVAILWAAGAYAADRAIEDFFGEYTGRTISASANEVKTRDINVEIKEIRRRIQRCLDDGHVAQGGDRETEILFDRFPQDQAGRYLPVGNAQGRLRQPHPERPDEGRPLCLGPHPGRHAFGLRADRDGRRQFTICRFTTAP